VNKKMEITKLDKCVWNFQWRLHIEEILNAQSLLSQILSLKRKKLRWAEHRAW